MEDTFLQLKKRGQKIMVSDFLFLFRRFNLLLLLKEKKKKVIDNIKLSVTKVIKLFENKKTNKSY